MQPILASLSPEEQAALKLCGITKDTQLARTHADALARDLQVCREHFPELACEIPLQKLRLICAEARTQHGELEGAVREAPSKEAQEQGELFFTRAYPTLVVSKHRRSHKPQPGATVAHPLSATDEEIVKEEVNLIDGARTSDRQERVGKVSGYEFHNAVHSAHPLAVYLGAWATLLFVADIAAIIIVPLLIILGFEIPINIKTTGVAIAIAGALPYFCLRAHAVCSVCRVSVFSFKKYSHNRQAHWMPLLGCAIPTALHVAFCFWFRCPACGTPQKLFRRTGRH
ncbi:MAG: hypothetical protein IKV82_07500 [Akkermansia sp.]|nr:hypothetical protein [Akkermansia sp.]